MDRAANKTLSCLPENDRERRGEEVDVKGTNRWRSHRLGKKYKKKKKRNQQSRYEKEVNLIETRK